VLRETVLGAERLGDRLRDEGGVAERGEPNPEDARLVLGDEGRGGLERKAGLARAAGAGQGEQARALLDPGEHLMELALPADEGARRAREVRVRDRLERREAAFPELEDGNRLGDVLEPVLAEVEERVSL
jgi:hypothetical protein